MIPYKRRPVVYVPNLPSFPRRTAVTIAAGFKCTDGVVLAADTQETVGDYKKRNCAKITVKPAVNPIPDIREPRRISDPRPPEVVPPTPDLSAGVAGAGDSSFLEKLIDKAWLRICQTATFEERCAALEEGIIEFYERFWPIYPESMKPEAELLIGLWSPSEFELLKVIGPLMTKVDSHTFIGCGSAEANSFADRIDLRKLTVKKASSVGIYILKAVKEQVPYCGGDSHLLLMDDRGHAYFENPWSVKWAEEKLRRLEEAVGPLILAAASSEANSEDFQKSLDEFGGKLLTIKAELERIARAIDQASDYRPGK
jgi:hypothetical protein